MTCCPENCNAIREACRGGDPSEGSQPHHPASLPPGSPVADGLVSTPVTGMELDRPVVEALSAMVATRPRWGFWKCYDRLRLDGQTRNHKRVYRMYCAM